MLASKEYLESKFKEMISESMLNEKLNELKTSVENKMKNEFDKMKEDQKALKDQ
jgi:hypothetical protein